MAYDRLEHGGGAVDTTLSSDISAVDTTASLADATAWPDGNIGPFYVLIDPDTAGEEKMLATSLSGVTLSGLTRGVDGTGAFAHSAGATVKHVFAAVEADEANYVVARTVGQIAGKGDLSVGSAANDYGTLAAPASNLTLIGDTGATLGMDWGQITEDQIAAATFGAGLQGGDGTTVTAKTDGTTIDTAGTGTSLEVKPLGIGTAQIAASAVTTAKIADANVTTAKIADANVTAVKIADANVTGAKFANEAWTSYTPSWTSATSTNPTLSNGVIVGAYHLQGLSVWVRISLTIGSTTLNGASSWQFTLPVAAHPTALQSVAGFIKHGSDASNRYPIAAIIDPNISGGSTTNFWRIAGAWGSDLGPFVPNSGGVGWPADSIMVIEGTYERA